MKSVCLTSKCKSADVWTEQRDMLGGNVPAAPSNRAVKSDATNNSRRQNRTILFNAVIVKAQIMVHL